MVREQRNDLSDLVRDRRAELRLSYRDLASRCVDPETGTHVSYSWLQRLETRHPSVTLPGLAEVHGLARGLDVPLRVIQDAAAAQFLGLTAVWDPRQRVRALVAHFDEMTEEDQSRLQAIVEAFTAPYRQSRKE